MCSLMSMQGKHCVFAFTTVRKLIELTHEFHDRSRAQNRSQYLTFHGVPDNIVEQVDFPHDRITYTSDTQILSIKMVSLTHDTAASMFAQILSLKFAEIGIIMEVTPVGSGRATMGNVRKEPDGSWGPPDKEYSTLILEVRMSQDLEELLSDKDIWFTSENSHVSQLVLIDIVEKKPQLTIQKWVAPTKDLRKTEPAKMTREVKVLLKDGVPTADGIIMLSFEKLLERQPQQKSRERDIKFSRDDLAVLAKKIWTKQGFMS